MTTYIVVPPRQVAAADASLARPTAVGRAAELSRRREINVGLMRETLDDDDLAEATMSVAGEDAGVPLEGSSAGGRKVPLSLDALGLVILRDPTTVQLEKLQRAGARLLPNVEVSNVEPQEEDMPATGIPVGDALWHLDYIGARAMHQRGITGRGMLLGVVDTGVDAGHPELDGRVAHYMQFNPDASFASGLRRDFGDHGTHVCGTIAGRNCGVAPDAKLAVAAALTRKNANGKMCGTIAQVFAATNWLLQTDFTSGPMLAINLSLASERYDDYLYGPISDARLIRRILCIAAIGNSGRPEGFHGSPANYDTVLGIGAVDRFDNAARFSDWGQVSQHPGITKPDMAAPGVQVFSSVPGGLYAAKSGTSMATPCVTGACALLAQDNRSLVGDPDALATAITAKVRGLSKQPRAGTGVLHLA